MYAALLWFCIWYQSLFRCNLYTVTVSLLDSRKSPDVCLDLCDLSCSPNSYEFSPLICVESSSTVILLDLLLLCLCPWEIHLNSPTFTTITICAMLLKRTLTVLISIVALILIVLLPLLLVISPVLMIATSIRFLLLLLLFLILILAIHLWSTLFFNNLLGCWLYC